MRANEEDITGGGRLRKNITVPRLVASH